MLVFSEFSHSDVALVHYAFLRFFSFSGSNYEVLKRHCNWGFFFIINCFTRKTPWLFKQRVFLQNRLFLSHGRMKFFSSWLCSLNSLLMPWSPAQSWADLPELVTASCPCDSRCSEHTLRKPPSASTADACLRTVSPVFSTVSRSATSVPLPTF